MLEKRLFIAIMRKIRHGGVAVNFWDGEQISFGPDSPYFTLTIKHPRVLRAMAKNLTLGFGEGYMNGDIDIDGPLDQIGRLVSENHQAFSSWSFTRNLHLRKHNVPQNQAKFVQHHYDLGNDFYKLWLDASMTYSCAYFKTSDDTLEQAQQQKIEHILRKLQLKKGMRLLDIGSGWGNLLITAAKQYGVTGLGITLSKEQHKLSNQRAKNEGVNDLISFKLLNYRDLAEGSEQFDRIVSVGMFEHVGRQNHPSYYRAVNKMLVPGGISVLHTISNQIETPNDPWIDKYIFPGGYIPASREVMNALPEYGFNVTDYENLRIHYAMTLDEWLRRFDQNIDTIRNMYDNRFIRMWRLYLSQSSAGFRYGDLGLSQFVFSKGLNNDLPLTRDFLYK